MSTASNYANDWEQCIPLRPDLAVNGPFMHDPTKELPRYVLTKTHCTGTYRHLNFLLEVYYSYCEVHSRATKALLI